MSMNRVTKTGPLGTALWIALPVVAAGLFYVWTHVTTVRLGYDLSRADQAHQRLLEEQQLLRVKHGNLVNPQHLERLARARGFAYRPHQTVELGER